MVRKGGIMKTTSLETAGNMFNYRNQKCDCKITTTYDENGMELHSIMMKGVSSENYLYAYAPIVGLAMINQKTGSILDNKNIVEDFVNLDFTDINALKKFVDSYGFLTNLPEDKYASLNISDLAPIFVRFRVLVELMTEIEADQINYNGIFEKVCQLLFAQPRNIVIESINEQVLTCNHPFTAVWYNMNMVSIVNDDFVEIGDDAPYSNYYLVYDSFTGKTEKMDYIKYNEDTGQIPPFDYDNLQSKFLANITLLYKNYLNYAPPVTYDQKSAKDVIDFLYHLLNAGMVIVSFNSDGKINMPTKLSDNEQFGESFKNKLLEIARQTIKEEFDFMLCPIHPVYDMKTMGPGWQVPNLITALYFSLFYTRPDYEIYRKCANPNCNRLFKVKTTNSKQMYHDSACQNAAAQMRHRKKMKK